MVEIGYDFDKVEPLKFNNIFFREIKSMKKIQQPDSE